MRKLLPHRGSVRAFDDRRRLRSFYLCRRRRLRRLLAPLLSFDYGGLRRLRLGRCRLLRRLLPALLPVDCRRLRRLCLRRCHRLLPRLGRLLPSWGHVLPFDYRGLRPLRLRH